MNQDEEHLKILAVFDYVVGALAALFACFFLFYVVMGAIFIAGPTLGHANDARTAVTSWFMVAFGGMLLFTGWGFAGALIAAGRCLSARRHHTFCLVMAGVACIFMPFGTVLGVFTIIVLSRSSVRALFGMPAPLSQPAA
jgi:hypothetical protein